MRCRSASTANGTCCQPNSLDCGWGVAASEVSMLVPGQRARSQLRRRLAAPLQRPADLSCTRGHLPGRHPRQTELSLTCQQACCASPAKRGSRFHHHPRRRATPPLVAFPLINPTYFGDQRTLGDRNRLHHGRRKVNQHWARPRMLPRGSRVTRARLTIDPEAHIRRRRRCPCSSVLFPALPASAPPGLRVGARVALTFAAPAMARWRASRVLSLFQAVLLVACAPESRPGRRGALIGWADLASASRAAVDRSSSKERARARALLLRARLRFQFVAFCSERALGDGGQSCMALDRHRKCRLLFDLPFELPEQRREHFSAQLFALIGRKKRSAGRRELNWKRCSWACFCRRTRQP